MTEPRRILLTSAGTGVGNAALTAMQRSAARYVPIVTNAEPFHSGVFRSDVCYLAPRVEDDPEAWACKILKIVRTEGVRLVVPCRDGDIAVAAGLRERLRASGAEVAAPDEWIATASMDKLAADALLTSLGLPTPGTTAADDAAGLRKVTALGYPVIAKPRWGTGSVGVRLLRTALELGKFLASVGELAGSWVVQEYLPIEGPLHSVTDYTALAQDREFSLQLLFDGDGRVRVWMATVNTLENGLPVAVRFDRSEPVKAAVDRLPSPMVGMKGPLNLQARLRDGELVFFEANARLTGITGTRCLFGLNEVDVLWDLLVEQREPTAVRFDADICVYRNLEDTAFGLDYLRTLQEVGRWRR